MQVSSSTEQGLGALAMDFALGEQLSTKCSFLPLTFLFSSAPGPQATMDAHLGGQESASKSSKGSSSTGDQQGHYPCVKSSNWDVCLILDGMAVSPPPPPNPPHPGICLTRNCLWACSKRAQLQTISVQRPQAASDGHQARCSHLT